MSSGIYDDLDQGHSPATVEDLVERLRDADPDVRDEARDALTAIGRRQARRLQPHPAVNAGKSLVVGLLTVIQILLGLALLGLAILKFLLAVGGP